MIIDRKLVGDPKNDLLSWRVMVAALNDFHRHGLELDPHGFLIICQGLEKASHASFNVTEEEKREFALHSSQIPIIVNEFMKMSKVIPSREEFRIPELLHAIYGVHLHAYVRVLNLAEDYDGIMYVLEWMVKHHEALEKLSTLPRNGPKMIRRVFVAMRVFFLETKYEARAEELVNSVERWDGWPSEYEAKKYIDYEWSGTEDESEEEISGEKYLHKEVLQD